MNKRFLVTGGCGFIGSHLVDYLCDLGHFVTVIDDLSFGSQSIKRFSSLERFIEKKLQDFKIMTLGKFDGVFHLAAQASVFYRKYV